MRTFLALGALLLLLVPFAAAVDLLPAEARLGPTEARLIARSGSGLLTVRTEPGVLVGGAAPGGEPAPLAPAPRELQAIHTWRGLDGIVEIVLRREDVHESVDVIVEDGGSAGVWVEWPAARTIPAPHALAALVIGLALRPLLRR